MARVTTPAAEEALDQYVKVLDHGFVALKDYMGGDESIVQAARVSTGKGTKTPEEDRKLIHYLFSHHHTTPFEMVELKFHMQLPIFVARQLIRHRTASVNEFSMRYSEARDLMYVPELDQVRGQATMNKQGSGGVLDDQAAKMVVDIMGEEHKEAFANYENFREWGVARELARINLPVATYTEWYWKVDLNNLFKMLRLRMDHHAQYEIRVFANVMYEMTKKVVPIACEAFEEHMMNAQHFSFTELKLLINQLGGAKDEWAHDYSDLLVALGSERAVAEFLAKLNG